MKISIAIPYYNRKNLFYRTLKSIAKTKHDNFEVIAVDDGSLEEERIEDLMFEFSFLKVFRLKPKDKWYNSAVIPYNLAIAKADGDIIVLQNPESFHVHDVLMYLAKKINDSNYISMSTYSINKELTDDLQFQIDKKDFIHYFKSLPQQHVCDYVGWYNHSEYNPVYYQFCGALTRKNMEALGGFDERYAGGIGFEDNDLIDRISKLGLKKIINDSISVIHQWHPKVFDLEIPEHAGLYNRNCSLFNSTRNEKSYKVSNSFREE